MTATDKSEKKKDPFGNDVEIQWCPGCPNFSILKAFKNAFEQLEMAPDELCLVSGIGQAAKLPHYLRCNFFNGLHGRALPVATAIKAANPKLTTIVVTGDGDCYGEGGNHFLHALRRNPDLTLVVHNNEIYALTKGQASPTTPKGEKRSIHSGGVRLEPLNATGLAIMNGCTFVARGFAPEIDQLTSLLKEAVQHRGLAYVDVIQPCISWGTHPVSWYKERVEKLPEDYDPQDLARALTRSLDPGFRFRTGILYRGEPRATFGESFRKAVTDRPLAELGPMEEDRAQALLNGFRPE